MKSGKLVLGVVTSAACVTGCASGSIYREANLAKSGKSLILDARQRVVNNYDADPWEDKNGPPRYINPTRIVCPEPSPDVASSLSTAITTSLSNIQADGSRQSANMGFAAAESLAQLGQRLATTQLLRDELADLCRSYANGAISTTNYTLRLAQLDEKMVTLLTAEMIAGAFQRDSIAINGSTAFAGGGSGSGGSPKSADEIEKFRVAIKTEQDKYTTADELYRNKVNEDRAPVTRTEGMTEEQYIRAVNNDENTYRQEVLRLQRDRDSAEEQVRLARIAYNEARDPASSTAIGLPQAGAATFGGQAASIFGANPRTAEHLVTLQQNYLDRDELGAIVDTCLTRMNEDVLYRPSNEEILAAGQETGRLAEQRTLAMQEANRLEQAWNDAARARSAYYQTIVLEAEAQLPDNATDADRGRTIDGILAASPARKAELERLIQVESESYTAYQNAKTAVEERDFVMSVKTRTDEALEFDRVCKEMLLSFSKQLIHAQNTRMELKLKSLEADVQIANAEVRQSGFCNELLQIVLAKAEDEPLTKAQQLAIEACATPAGSGSLGDLGAYAKSIQEINLN